MNRLMSNLKRLFFIGIVSFFYTNAVAENIVFMNQQQVEQSSICLQTKLRNIDLTYNTKMDKILKQQHALENEMKNKSNYANLQAQFLQLQSSLDSMNTDKENEVKVFKNNFIQIEQKVVKKMQIDQKYSYVLNGVTIFATDPKNNISQKVAKLTDVACLKQ